MNTSVTRGRGEMIVTTTGMDTEIGHIADLLNKTEADKTPLQKQLDRLTILIAGLAGLAFVLMVVLGLAQGQTLETLFIAGVSLAIAAIPTGLPAVVTTLYSMGTRVLADPQRHRQAPAVGGDAGLRLRHLLGQDRHPDPEQDDGAGVHRPRPEPLQGHRRGVQHRGPAAARHRGQDRPGRHPAADGAVRRRPPGRREPDRRPDRGRADRAGGEGGHRPGRRAGDVPPRGRGAVRLRLQVHGHLPRHARRAGQAGRALLRQGRAGRAHRAGRLVLAAGRRDGADHRREPPPRPGRERPHRAGGRAGDGRGPARLRPADVRSEGQPARPGA